MADKLFSSFGQDILDSLFWTATEPKDRKREHIGVLPHLVIAIIYVGILTQETSPANGANGVFDAHAISSDCFVKHCHLFLELILVSLETFSKDHLYYQILL